MSLPLAIAGPSSSKLKSCDSCRLRRIKCVREPAGNETCQKCAEKSIRCTVLRQMNPRRKMNRDGSVIARARETFGSAGALTKHQYTNEIFEEGIRSFNALPSSTNSKLGDAEIEGTLTLHLMEEFFSNHYGQMQPLNWVSFRSRFDAAGKRPENMLPQEEVLCAFLIMMGARLSDHPLLLRGTTGLLASPDSGQSSGRSGSQSPDSADASDGTVSTQTDIGKLREHVNRKLFERAISLADAKGTIRNPTEESIASLLFMHQGLTRDERMVQGRIYCKATLEHIRILAEQNDALPLTVQPKNRTIGDRAWNLWLMDAMIVARSGIKPTFDEEDFIRYCPTSDMSLTDILPLFKTSPWKGFPSLKGHEEGYFWTCVTPFLREIGNTGLKIGKFTSPRALKLPFQEKQFLEVISALYFLQLSMPHLEPALLKLRPEFIEVWPCNALYYL
ncbi:hypothetical protein BT69DRAFT_917787 [Atractiella rhizophila]|nr:hypothetical protein BT69DRAFT_917787 [Atractiella rhizophila]